MGKKLLLVSGAELVRRMIFVGQSLLIKKAPLAPIKGNFAKSLRQKSNFSCKNHIVNKYGICGTFIEKFYESTPNPRKKVWFKEPMRYEILFSIAQYTK